MIIDSSVLVAIIIGEPGFERYKNAILADAACRISAFSVYEAAVVLLRKRGRTAVEALHQFLGEAGVVIEAFATRDALAAINVYARFGKGISPISLNLGDCPVYALAETSDLPVLSTSDEFARAGLRTQS